MISIVIPTHNRNELLIKHLLILKKELAGFQYEVIVVNDYSFQPVELPEELNFARIFNNPKAGVASSRNYGASQAVFPWILFMDDDMIINKKSFEIYLSMTDRTDKFTVNVEWIYDDQTNLQLDQTAFGRFLKKYGFNSLRGWNDFPDWTENGLQVTEGITSNNIMIRKSLFTEIGGYNEDFPFAGAEDFDFSKRLIAHDFKMYVDTSAKMIHNEIDRLQPDRWLERKFRDGVTKRKGFELGHESLFVPNRLRFRFPVFLNIFCKIGLFFTRRFKAHDKVSFKMYSAMLGQAIHSGFYHKKHMRFD